MDLLEEYKDKLLDDYIEGIVYGAKVWFKTTEEGDMIIYSPYMVIGRNNKVIMLKIKVEEELGNSLEILARAEDKGCGTYHLVILKFREEILDDRPIE